MDYFDVVVIGAGPAGLIAAREVAERGLKVIVIEEDNTIGRPERCAGLYSIDGVNRIKVPIDRSYVQNYARGAVFKSPSGIEFTVEANRDVALVANRERFDQFLAQRAIYSGADIILGRRVSEIKKNGDEGYLVRTRDKVFSCRFVIDCEGRGAFLARSLHPSYNLTEWIPIIQYQVANHGLDKDFVYLYFKRYLPDFFAYLVPIDDELGKIGIAALKNINEKALRFMQEEFPKARIVGVSSSSIYAGKPLERPRVDRIYFVGDVAGHVKATTGGGVIFGGKFALAAAGEIIAGDRSFDDAVKRLYPELNKIWWVRRLVSKLSPNHLDILFKAAKESGIHDFLSKSGDMDYHGTTAMRLLTSGKMFKMILSMLRIVLKF